LKLASIAGCTAPDPEPEQRPRDRVEQSVRADDGPLTFSMRRVRSSGWSGRVVVASFAPRDRRIRVVPSDHPQPLDAIVGPVGARQPYAAIDGGFYDTDGEPMGLVRTGARDVHALAPNGGSGVLVIDGGAPRIVAQSEYREASSITDALQSIDRIVVDGRSVVSPNASQRRAARSAVAIDGDGTLHLMIAFDDRAIEHEEEALIELGAESTGTGPTLAEMAEIAMAPPDEGGVSARDALGMDGGFSTSLTVKSDTRAMRILAYRATINAVLVYAE
jgi:hypothetical protein